MSPVSSECLFQTLNRLSLILSPHPGNIIAYLEEPKRKSDQSLQAFRSLDDLIMSGLVAGETCVP